jgi:hypothetical protein
MLICLNFMGGSWNFNIVPGATAALGGTAQALATPSRCRHAMHWRAEQRIVSGPDGSGGYGLYRSRHCREGRRITATARPAYTQLNLQMMQQGI